MFRIFEDKSRTADMEMSAPANAAPAISAEFNTIAPRAAAIRERATMSRAPDDTPRTNGPAMGLWKKVWSMYPASASAPPSIIAASVLGRRILKRIIATVPPLPSPAPSAPVRIRQSSPGVISALPADTPRKKNPAVSRRSRRKEKKMRLFINQSSFRKYRSPPPSPFPENTARKSDRISPVFMIS